LSISLNDEQKQAVEYTGGPLLVSAGPGSGKTRVIVERVKFLIKSGIKEPEILCLTFSEKAADEMKTRLEEDGVDISDMQISTYHAFCNRVLDENIMNTGIGKRGGIVDRSNFMVWGLQNMDSFGFDEHLVIGNNAVEVIESLIDGISTFKDELVRPESIEEYVRKKLDGTLEIKDPDDLAYVRMLGNLAKMYRKYDEFKRQKNIMDFDDLIVLTYNFLNDQAKKHILEHIRNRYRHILVDEFQDNNYAQFSILKLLVKDGNITVVGDEDQSIYRFQGAYPEIFNHFRQHFADHHEILLSKNYRNPPAIVDLSGQLLARDVSRPPKNIVPVKDDQTKVTVAECATEADQTEFVTSAIKDLVNNHGMKFGDIAILARKQKDGLKFTEALSAEGIPCTYVGKSRIRGSKAARRLLTYLRAISDPSRAAVHISYILREHGITEMNIHRINTEAKKRARASGGGDHVFEVLSDLAVPELTQTVEIAEIRNTLESFIKISQAKSVPATTYEIAYLRTGIFRDIIDDSFESFQERSVLQDIQNAAVSFQMLNPEGMVLEFLGHLRYLEEFEMQLDLGTKTSNAVQVSTIHQSKGKEFGAVFIVDVASRKIPLDYSEKPFYVPRELASGLVPSLDPKTLFTNEERRVLYVGMTRAKDCLYLSYPTQYASRKKQNKASKFLQEVKPEKNPAVDFQKYSGAKSTERKAPSDPIEKIASERLDVAIRHLTDGQYDSAILAIQDLLKIKYFKEKGTTDGFAHAAPSQANIDLDSILNGHDGTVVDIDKLRLSPTSLQTYQKCPYQFKFGNIFGIEPVESKKWFYIGNIFHKIAEISAKNKAGGQNDSMDDLKKMLETLWDSNEFLELSVAEEKEARKNVEKMLETYHEWASANNNTIKDVEKRFEIEVAGRKIRGKIDLIEETPSGDIEVFDFKTGKPVNEKAHENLQLNSYALGCQTLYGKLPSKVSLFYVMSEPEERFQEYIVTAEQVETVKQEMENLVRLIQSRDFTAKPDMFTCKYCDFRDICEFAQ
jgi:DNA helicase II / ATP-dependent DNA helicase PcrA